MLAAAAGFTLLLGTAAISKLRDLAGFKALAEDYRLVPVSMLGFAARVIPVVELALAAVWLAAPWHADAALNAGVGTTVLMLGYGLAIAVNLLRGRSWIDCGCGAGEQLSWALVGRNIVLAALALSALAVAGGTPPGWADFAVSVPILAVAALLYLAAGALLANTAAMRIWREAA